ncbi:hypothetical protein DSECCO2_364250 [anaerobic digester metagenome]
MRQTLQKCECNQMKKLKFYFWCGEKAEVFANASAKKENLSYVTPHIYEVNADSEIKNKLKKFRTYKASFDPVILYVEEKKFRLFSKLPRNVQVIFVN